MISFPIHSIKKLKEEEPKRAWIKDVDLVKKMIACADSPSTKLKLRLGFEAGLRSGEILRLRLEGIDILRKILTVYGEKENRYKEIEISDDMANDLEPLLTHRYDRNGFKLIERNHQQQEFLFCNEKGEPYKTFKKAFDRTKQKAGIKGKLSPHSMRHTFASHLLQNGANPVDVSKMLGHKKVSTTLDIYSHSSRNSRRSSFEKLPYLRKEMGTIIEFKKAKKA